MAQFNVQYTNGSQCKITAQRLILTGDRLLFLRRTQQRLVTVCELETHEVVGVRRSIIEYDGTMRWMTEPISTSAQGERR